MIEESKHKLKKKVADFCQPTERATMNWKVGVQVNKDSEEALFKRGGRTVKTEGAKSLGECAKPT